MDTNTNRKKTRRQRERWRRNLNTTFPSQPENRDVNRWPERLPAAVDRDWPVPTQSQLGSVAAAGNSGPGDARTSLSVAPAADDVCPVSKSIEAVLVSKTEAHRQRTQQKERKTRYPNETRRPIVCLAFVLPLLIAYEIGFILLGQPSMRSGIDQWFHQPLYRLGFGGLVVLPIVTVAALIAWHHHQQDHWRIKPAYLAGMLIEAVGLGLILFWAANAINLIEGGAAMTVETTRAISSNAWWANVVACIGSGIYEELIFRIGLLSLLILWVSKLMSGRRSAALGGVITVSLLFAALHYSVFNPAGNPFELSSFIFRFFASIVFCVLFLFRGFGIAVGSHVAYDVLTQL